MSLLRLRILVLLGSAALAPSAAQGGAWTMPEGAGQIVTTATASQARKSFDSGGRLRSTPQYSKIELQSLMEYGVSDWFTVMLMPGLQGVSIAAPVDASRSGLGYTEFGGRLMLARGSDWVLSGQATARIPGTSDAGNPAAIGYTGAEYDLRALFGTSFLVFGMTAFFDAQLAQRFRTGDPPNETRADLTVGLHASPEWLLLAQSFNVISHGGGSGPLFPAYNYHKLQISALYVLSPKWALQGGAFTTFAGHNALQENGLVLGAWYRFP